MGLDWIASGLCLWGLYWAGRNPLGFLCCAGGSVFWVLYGIYAGSLALELSSTIYFVLNVRLWAINFWK